MRSADRRKGKVLVLKCLRRLECLEWIELGRGGV